MNNIDKQLLATYQEQRSRYEELDTIVYEKLCQIIEENNFFIMDISHRVKTIKSLKGKLKKKQGKYKSILDITDLCAARIICYFLNTVDWVADALRKHFIVDEANSVDKADALKATQFGYLSLHYILSLKPDEGYSPELCAIRFEIQTRTVLQHAWAEIEHDLGYKSTFGVPRPIRREFSRIAGLLEIADNQFLGLRKNIAQYEEDIRRKIDSGEGMDLPLDEVTLNEFTRKNKNFLDHTIKCAENLKVEYIPVTAEKYLERLDWLGIKKLGDLKECFMTNGPVLLKLLKSAIDTYELDILTTTMLFKNLCHAELARGGYNLEQVTRYMMIKYATPELAKEHAEKYFERMKRFGVLPHTH